MDVAWIWVFSRVLFAGDNYDAGARPAGDSKLRRSFLGVGTGHSEHPGDRQYTAGDFSKTARLCVFVVERTIAALVCLLGMALYPNLVTSRPDIKNSLTIYNAASSPKTHLIMTIIVVIGMPFVLAYTGIVYWTFRGKVRLEEHSY